MSTDQLGITDISLRHLKSALYVFEHKNVTRAANKLNRSQTAITKAIGELESELNCSLFDRSSTGMLPTVHGEALAHRVRLAANEFDRAGQAYQQFVPDGRAYQSIPVFSMDISYKRLAAFIALFQVRDIREAAKLLGVTKAAVYNSVRQMEELLDLSLFEREPGGVAPTSFCSILARHTKLAFAEIRHALEDIASLDGITQGNVSIGTLPYTRTYLTPRAINRLLKTHPQLNVTTQEGPYAALQASLRSGDLDVIVGAVRIPAPGSDIVTETLIEDRLAVIARKNHPLTKRRKISFRDLQDLEWVLPAKETPSRQLFDDTFRKHNMDTPKQAVQTSSQSMVRGLLLDSDRVALLSEHQIYYDRKAGLLEVLPVELEETYRPIGITLRALTQPSPAASLFLDELRSVAKELRN
ncbi:transcriptional regulator, LysR family [gamma proteobacterium NOR5-3]|nr:transcriptional regulator, LysR family [gamma proteobacterium NOR5-3]